MIWTPEDDGILHKHSRTHTAAQLAEMLQRTPTSVYSRARTLGISLQKRGEHYHLTKHPDAVVRQAKELRTRGYTSREIAAQLNVPFGTVEQWIDGYCRVESWMQP